MLNTILFFSLFLCVFFFAAAATAAFPSLQSSEGTVTSGGPLVAEDKISFGLNALSFTDISLEDLLVSGGERDGMSFLKEVRGKESSI